MKITLLGNSLNPIRKNGLVTGYSVAANDLTQSFLKYSKADEVYCLYEPGQYQETWLRQYEKNNEANVLSPKVQMISEYDLLFHGFDKIADTTVIHSVKEDAMPLLSMREMMRKKIPLTMTFHGLAEQHLILDTFYPMVYLPFKPYDAVICTSDAVLNTLGTILERMEHLNPELTRCVGPHKLRLKKIPLSVDTAFFSPMNKQLLRKRMGIAEDAFVILWFGRFSGLFKADLYPLLHCFAQLLRNNPNNDLRLILAGSQDQSIDYVQMMQRTAEKMGIAEKVSIIFNENIDNRAELYSVSDVFTSPVDNIQETFGLTPIEAMSCGVPQVVSDWDGYRSTVKDGKTGFLIATVWCDCLDDITGADYLPSHPEHRRLLQRSLTQRSIVIDCADYTRKLQRLIDDRELWKMMSSESRKTAEKYFDLKCTVVQTEDLWEELCEIAEQSSEDFFPKRIPTSDYCHDFRSYPQRFLTDDVVFSAHTESITDFEKIPMYESFTKYIEESSLPSKILNMILYNDLSIGEIIPALPYYTSDQIRRAVMFLYKYDIIYPIKQ